MTARRLGHVRRHTIAFRSLSRQANLSHACRVVGGLAPVLDGWTGALCPSGRTSFHRLVTACLAAEGCTPLHSPGFALGLDPLVTTSTICPKPSPFGTNDGQRRPVHLLSPPPPIVVPHWPCQWQSALVRPVRQRSSGRETGFRPKRRAARRVADPPALASLTRRLAPACHLPQMGQISSRLLLCACASWIPRRPLTDNDGLSKSHVPGSERAPPVRCRRPSSRSSVSPLPACRVRAPAMPAGRARAIRCPPPTLPPA